MKMTDIKIEARLQFDYKLAIEDEIKHTNDLIKVDEEQIKDAEKSITFRQGIILGLQIANNFFDEYKKNEEE